TSLTSTRRPSPARTRPVSGISKPKSRGLARGACGVALGFLPVLGPVGDDLPSDAFLSFAAALVFASALALGAGLAFGLSEVVLSGVVFSGALGVSSASASGAQQTKTAHNRKRLRPGMDDRAEKGLPVK